MGFFNISKKKLDSKVQMPSKTTLSKESLDKLVNGELPWGWIYDHKEFVNKITDQHKYFLNLWLDSRNKSPKEQYSSLKSFILFLNDYTKLCSQKGECYIKWFNDCIADDAYIQERTKELNQLSSNFDNLSKIYNTRIKALPNIEKQILQYIRSHPGILQKELYHYFDIALKSDVSEKIYYLSKSGKIKRIKHGNTYELYL